jgi:hypothetical protein
MRRGQQNAVRGESFLWGFCAAESGLAEHASERLAAPWSGNDDFPSKILILKYNNFAMAR